MTISEQAKQVYELELKARLEAEHRDKYLAIEPQSKAYFLGDTFLAAALAAKNALSNHDAARLASLQSVKGPEHREKIAIPLAAIESALRAKSDPLQSLKALGVTDPNLVSVFLKDPELVNQAVTILGMWREEFALSDSTLQELLLVKDREDVEYDFRKWAYILYLNNSDAKQREREFQSRLAGASLVELESFLGYLASNFSAESPESKDWHSRTLVEFEKSLEADPHAGRMLGFVLHSEYAHDQKYADQVARCVF